MMASVDGIHLVLSSLGAVVVECSGVRSVRAEDASGSFGLLPGHADLLTVLVPGVLSWRTDDDARWQYCAVRGGVLTLRGGRELRIATREAVPGDDLERLEQEVRTRLVEQERRERSARSEARQLELRALRELMRPLRAAGGTFIPPGAMP